MSTTGKFSFKARGLDSQGNKFSCSGELENIKGGAIEAVTIAEKCVRTSFGEGITITKIDVKERKR